MATDILGTIWSVTGEQIPVYDGNYDNSQMDQEDFLKVLLTSFAYQDPFETQDINQFIDNTVKLRELEIMDNFEKSVQALNSNDTLFLNSTNLIGEKVLYEGNIAYVENGEGYVEFMTLQAADNATVYLYDADGNVVAEKSFTEISPNTTYSFSIDDVNLADGFYRVDVVAKKDNESIDTKIFSQAKITGIEKGNNEILAIIDGERVSLTDLIKIGG